MSVPTEVLDEAERVADNVGFYEAMSATVELGLGNDAYGPNELTFEVTTVTLDDDFERLICEAEVEADEVYLNHPAASTWSEPLEVEVWVEMPQLGLSDFAEAFLRYGQGIGLPSRSQDITRLEVQGYGD